MAARRKTNSRRRRRANPVNPARRRRTYRRRNALVSVRANPRRRRRSVSRRRNPFRRRRNPGALGSVKGLFTGATFVAIGVVGTQFAAGFIPVLPFGNWGVLAAKAGAAYGVGMLAHKFAGVSQQNATLMTLGGLAGVVQDAFDLFRQKFPGVLQAAAVQVSGTPATSGPPPASTGATSNLYGDSLNDIALFGGSGGGMWGRGSGMGDMVLFGRR